MNHQRASAGAIYRPVLFVLGTVFCLTSAGGALMSAQAPAAGRTVWDGVYTDAQATRGTQVFAQTCTNCHTLAAQGNRPLTGDKFWEGWTQKSVGDLLKFVSTNMPNGNGGSLSPSTYNDLVALILRSNGFPTGTTELGPTTIADVQIIPKDGPGELPAGTLVRVVGCLAKNGRDWVLTSATTPQRIERAGVDPDDATRPLGDRSTPLKFVLTKLDAFVGQRMSASGLLVGRGGVDGLNVTTVNRVAETCP
jgi:S-disulfanyl-L-cysteine oxidoreductase SoxD